MNAEIYRGPEGVAALSDEAGGVAGGAVFLLVDGTPYGKAEILPWGGSASRLARGFLDDAPLEQGAWGERTAAALGLARRFVRVPRENASYYEDENAD